MKCGERDTKPEPSGTSKFRDCRDSLKRETEDIEMEEIETGGKLLFQPFTVLFPIRLLQARISAAKSTFSTAGGQ